MKNDRELLGEIVKEKKSWNKKSRQCDDYDDVEDEDDEDEEEEDGG